MRRKFYFELAFVVIVVFICAFACKVTNGVAIGIVAVIGGLCALCKKTSISVLCFLLVSFTAIINPYFRGRGGLFLPCARIGLIFMVACLLIVSARNPKRIKLPIGWLFVYLLVSVISSFGGWCPPVSFLKIVNFGFFLLGLHVTLNQIQNSEHELQFARAIFMAFSMILILGSMILYFIPSIGYSMELELMEYYANTYMTGEELISSGGQHLFNGIVMHSQALGPLVAMSFVWVFCDLFLAERRITLLHGIMLCIGPILMFMSRSRTALVAFVVPMIIFYAIGISKVRLPSNVRQKLNVIMHLFACVALIVIAISEVRSNAVSRWLRKTDDVAGDARNLMDAVTSSRMGAVEMNMDDFKRNPLFGMGFQTWRYHEYLYKAGVVSVFSAPIEKGVLPLMVLGETGIVGCIVFIIFLLNCYRTSCRNGHIAFLVCFTCMICANMGEASFFAPSSSGGIIWIYTAIGGMVLDCIARANHANEYAFRAMYN